MLHAVNNETSCDALGQQMVIEMRDCRSDRFDDLDWIRETLIEAARRAKATIVNVVFHKFNPIGISGVVVIAESHLAIHTWPEHRYAAIDIFTCGSTLDGNAAIAHIAKEFGSDDYTVTRISRGFVNKIAQSVNTMAGSLAPVKHNSPTVMSDSSR